MTPTEYAERVLFSTSLEEKLAIVPASKVIAETEPSSSRFKFQNLQPGRPIDLAFVTQKSDNTGRSALPSRPALVDEQARGRMLHFFANHELLAAELMALALLKFPDAPRAFRSGLLQTLREEQRHTKWYVERMKQCGVTFGEHGLNRFFWDAVAPMESPIDYVSRLSLTFEQANLDYAKHFAGVLREAGDTTSAKILDQIYKDEIGHVGYGLKWFRKWKSEANSDWEAFKKVLHFPLSPSRAKANGDAEFNASGRLEAGFDPDFTRSLALFERSKGRTPNVFFFNPEAEDHIAAEQDDRKFHPSGRVSALIRDVEIIQIFLARRDDIVLMQKPPSLAHREFLAKAGFVLPEFERLTTNREVEKSSLTRERKICAVKPWSRCPFAEKILEPLQDDSVWKSEFAALFSKTEQTQRFEKWMALSEIETGQQVEKAAFSAAGRGNRVSRTNPIVSSNQPCLIVEPWVERVFDYSVQFEYDGTTLENLGMIRQIIGPRGQYRGSLWQPKFLAGVDSDIARLMANDVMPLYATDSEMCLAIREWLDETGFTGPFGIDAFIYKTPDGSLATRPICEINPRQTMGRVALELARFVAPSRGLQFSLEKASLDLVSDFDLGKSGKLERGSLILNEIDENSAFAVKLEILG